MRSLILIVLILLFAINVYCIEDPPLITCIEVHEAGDVTIYWQSLDLSALQFEIFYSTDKINWNFAYSAEALLNTSLSYNHAGANANLQIYYYYITAIYPSGNIKKSDEFSTIFLGVIPKPLEGIAELAWVHEPLSVSSSDYYRIYESIYKFGEPPVWIFVDSTSHESFLDTIGNGLCLDSINYKIEVGNSYGCLTVSNIAGDWFSEKIKPDIPILDSVSINTEGNIILGWEPVDSPDISNIVVYRKVGTTWPPNTEVTIPYTTFYEDTIQDPCLNKNIIYAIASLDSCDNISPKTEDSQQRPIFLYDIEYEICTETNSIQWESYINATPPLDKYQIWVAKNNGPQVLLDEVDPTELIYYHTNVESTTHYSYFIRAKFGDFSSTSCVKSITTGSYTKPNSIYLANADVQTDNTIDLSIDLDLIPWACTWEILRSDANGTIQSLVSTINRSEVTTSPYIFEDMLADGSTGYYTYSVNVFDSCGAEVLQSNTLKTIYLRGGDQPSTNENHLFWNSFQGWDEPVSKYYIFRIAGNEVSPLPIDSVDATYNEYIDDISLVNTSQSQFTYWVQAKEQQLVNNGLMEKSNSNRITFFRETELYMPNAFRPRGINNIFKPVTTGFGGSNYLFQIYNRWGQLIFETTDPQIGWDGTYDGNKSPQGTYIYRLVYQSVFGSPKSQNGTVTLID